MAEKDIGERFREKAGLVKEDFDGTDTHTQGLFLMAPREILNAQLNKALSTKLDNRYVLALIDTKEELPITFSEPNYVLIRLLGNDVISVINRDAYKDIQDAKDIIEKSKEGYCKVVHVFGGKE
jgi:hypothetical protein